MVINDLFYYDSLPDFKNPGTLVVFISFILSYMGVDASASYVNELDNPQKKYPAVMFMLVIAAIVINAVGGLSISAVVPQAQLSFGSGKLQALEVFFLHYGSQFGWLVRIMATLISLGVIAEVSGWIIGPARGIYAAAQQGLLPPIFRKVNKKNVPIPLIIVQGVVVSIWAAILTLGGGGNNVSFIVAISLTVVIYLMAYLLFYIGYFVLIFKKKDLKRTYQIRGCLLGKFIVASAGLITSVFAFVISFYPPSSIRSESHYTYQLLLIISFLITLTLPFIIYFFHDKQAHKSLEKYVHLKADEVNQFIHPRGRGEHKIIPDKDDFLD